MRGAAVPSSAADHLALDVDQVGDPLDQQGVAGRADRFGMAPRRAAPGPGGAAAAGDRRARAAAISSGSSSKARCAATMLRPHLPAVAAQRGIDIGERAIQRRILGFAPCTFLGHVEIGHRETEGRANGQSRRRRHAAKHRAS